MLINTPICASSRSMTPRRSRTYADWTCPALTLSLFKNIDILSGTESTAKPMTPWSRKTPASPTPPIQRQGVLPMPSVERTLLPADFAFDLAVALLTNCHPERSEGPLYLPHLIPHLPPSPPQDMMSANERLAPWQIANISQSSRKE